LAACDWGGPNDFDRSEGPKQCLKHGLKHGSPTDVTTVYRINVVNEHLVAVRIAARERIRHICQISKSLTPPRGNLIRDLIASDAAILDDPDG
jgi:hypothetical protein